MRDTSTEALISISHIRGALKKTVFEKIRTMSAWGSTCDELEEVLDLSHQTLSARVRELWQEGFINRTDRTRMTRSGRQARVYTARKARKKSPPIERRCEHCGQVIVKR